MKKSSFVELEGKEKRRPIQYLDIKVTTEGKGRTDQVIEELLEKVDISSCMNDHYDSIVLSHLLVKLQLDYNIPLEDRQIFYFFAQGQVFINCGIFPIGEQVKVELKEIDLNQFLHVKVRQLGLLHIDRLMYTQNAVSNIENEKEELNQEEKLNSKGNKQCRRTKERRIGYIIQKVIEWRKYYSGTSDQSLQHQKYSLEEAANKVGISKKSLDDYLFQIRFGYNNRFNFNEHYNEKVGILRDFVRQQKKSTNKGESKRKKKVRKEGKEDST